MEAVSRTGEKQMVSFKQIRHDLHDIRYYYQRKDTFEFSGLTNSITEKVKRYNTAVRTAEPRLFDIYVNLYVKNQTQFAVASELECSVIYVQKLNTRLLQFLQAQFN